MRRRGTRREGPFLRLNAPTQGLFALSFVLVLLAVAGRYTPVDYLTPNAFWFAVVGYVVLAFGVLFRRA